MNALLENLLCYDQGGREEIIKKFGVTQDDSRAGGLVI
jgi:hypothetical protein